MDIWESICPRCKGIGQNEDMTQAILKINHAKDCPYMTRGIDVTFTAQKITVIEMKKVE